VANDKKVYSASDAQPIVLYAKQDASKEQAYPLVASAAGGLLVHSGFAIPAHDKQVIDESGAPALTTITYSLSGITVATKTIVVSGTTTTITVV
jgi:hypothetical protein